MSRVRDIERLAGRPTRRLVSNALGSKESGGDFPIDI